MSKPFVDNLDINSSGFQLETELNLVAAYLKSDVLEIPISYSERAIGSESKLNTYKDGLKILVFGFLNWISFRPFDFFLTTAFLSGVLSFVLIFRVAFGFMDTGDPYTTTAVAAVGLGLISILSLFFGTAIKILHRDTRRQTISLFLAKKRSWNRYLDAF